MDINCTLPTDPGNRNKVVGVAGEHLPKVHFAGLGFALTDSLTSTPIEPMIDFDTMIYGSPHGGTLLSIPGRNFGAVLPKIPAGQN
ncbi:MAG: hypothetical protein QF535_03995 [Anaerolineales bacterium]|nr:hypothetical protein [Anaerolineales bacterium]